jgi:TolB protein
VSVRVRLRSIVPVDHLELVQDGRVVKTIPLEGDRTSGLASLRLPVSRSGWILLRARTDRAVEPVLDLYPYATTGPIYLSVAGRPVRSKADADFFLAWIDRIREAVGRHRDWNTDAERKDVLDMLSRARAEYERRAAE